MKRIAAIFRWVEDLLDPSRRKLLATLERDADNARTLRDMAHRSEQFYRAQAAKVHELNRKLCEEIMPGGLPCVSPEWAAEHQNGLVDFLRSPAGKAMLHRGRVIQHTLLVGDIDTQTPANPIAARTWCECLDWMESLSRASARSTEANPASADNSSETATQPEGDTVLRERLSP